MIAHFSLHYPDFIDNIRKIQNEVKRYSLDLVFSPQFIVVFDYYNHLFSNHFSGLKCKAS